MTEASAVGVLAPLHASTANALAHDLRKLARTQDLTAEERMALYDASSLLVRQAATIALIRNALGD